MKRFCQVKNDSLPEQDPIFTWTLQFDEKSGRLTDIHFNKEWKQSFLALPREIQAQMMHNLAECISEYGKDG